MFTLQIQMKTKKNLVSSKNTPKKPIGIYLCCSKRDDVKLWFLRVQFKCTHKFHLLIEFQFGWRKWGKIPFSSRSMYLSHLHIRLNSIKQAKTTRKRAKCNFYAISIQCCGGMEWQCAMYTRKREGERESDTMGDIDKSHQ